MDTSTCDIKSNPNKLYTFKDAEDSKKTFKLISPRQTGKAMVKNDERKTNSTQSTTLIYPLVCN